VTVQTTAGDNDKWAGGKVHPDEPQSVLPSDAAARKGIPIGTGVIDYFPAALAEVAKVSFAGNQQHNPGEPLHWSRGKSTDQADTIIRHYLERGKIDSDGQRHSAKLAWRTLALLQLELEEAGAPLARGATLPDAAPQVYPGYAIIKGKI
jgi:hypothetical protein